MHLLIKIPARLPAALTLLAAVALAPPQAVGQAGAAAAELLKVSEQEVDDFKTVFATVRSKDRIEARVRTPGTVVALKVDEGTQVEPGQVLAIVADPKIALRIKSIDAQIVGISSRVATARGDLDRAEQLLKRGVTSRARVDQLKTAYEIAANELKSARAELQVAQEQGAEGQVLAPAAGRILKVPVTVGSVVLPGESIATLAANQYLLRLELPERHARFIKTGDRIQLGPRGLSLAQKETRQGKIVQVYPELQGGRVVADATVSALGDYFVGERALVWISAGKRRTIVVPANYVTLRFGLDYIRLAQGAEDAADIVVQLGRPAQLPDGSPGIEILAGLKPGDEILPPLPPSSKRETVVKPVTSK